MGNSVIFKPAPETVLCGWILVNILWEAGIPKHVLQFINCVDEPIGSNLIADPRVNAIILTGATSTAKLFLSLRPGLDLSAETGGKNSIIVTSISDHDLAIKDIIHSAFGHSGQKCSAASLLILEAELYDDANFRKQLRDATLSLKVGSAWDFSSKIVPLIRTPNNHLLRGLTTLDKGETWLVQPKQDSANPNLWSPGIKFGVEEGSFMHQTELFGPVLGVMRARNLQHALSLANGTPYGLTAGLHSLDSREHTKWLHHIHAGNLYINRTVTGAIVKRQPFGGCKASSFGHGAKAGGPNYLSQFAHYKQIDLPEEKSPVPESVNQLTSLLQVIHLTSEELGSWFASAANYAYWLKKWRGDRDCTKILGQDNLFQVKSIHHLALRIQKQDKPLDLFRIFSAVLTTESHMIVSYSKESTPLVINAAWRSISPHLEFIQESEEEFCRKMQKHAFNRVRLASQPSKNMVLAASQSGTFINSLPIVANGRFELLHYLREVAVSSDYHRYGNLGIREGEPRKAIR
jgi:RHH-type proline utilization regulon transcriptional repressor/proline dehydrogenase/delta 1-pyrroline-5-carboxylate dehydrogenase